MQKINNLEMFYDKNYLSPAKKRARKEGFKYLGIWSIFLCLTFFAMGYLQDLDPAEGIPVGTFSCIFLMFMHLFFFMEVYNVFTSPYLELTINDNGVKELFENAIQKVPIEIAEKMKTAEKGELIFTNKIIGGIYLGFWDKNENYFFFLSPYVTRITKSIKGKDDEELFKLDPSGLTV